MRRGADFLVNWRHWSFIWESTFTGERWSRSADIADYRLAPWSLSDAALTYTLSLSQRLALDCSLRCNNLFNQSYQIVQGYPMPGFNAMLSVTLRVL